jgi:hypothetical protein
MSIKESLEQFRQEKRDLETKIKEAASVVFADGSKVLFETHPDLNSFSWNQYTPYFNDGDSCSFSTHTDSLKISFNGVNEDEDDDDDEPYSLYSIERRIATGTNWDNSVFVKLPVHDAALDIGEFLRNFTDEDLLSFFGDHVEITVHRDGKVSQEEYSHD